MHVQYALTGIRILLSSSLFGIALILLILFTFILPLPAPRFDVLFVAAILIQIFLIVFKYEHFREVLMIGAFHALGTCMEIFKVSVGSWGYPVDGTFYIGQVPFFAGFMYAAVGSAIARSMRLYSVQIVNAPDIRTLIFMSACIYCNFFTHHYIPDMRYLILGGVFFACINTRIHLKLLDKTFEIHFLAVAFIAAACIWCAENIATYASIWKYPHQTTTWRMVHFEKITSWFLLLLVSFTLVWCIVPRKHSTDTLPTT